MTRLIGITICLLFMMTMLVTSCSSADDTPGTFTDQLGRTVNLDKIPEKIVSIAPSNTEILFALGLGDKVVGVTEYCDYPAEAKEKETVGGFSTVDFEKVVALAPDLILAANMHQGEIIDRLESLGFTVMVLAPTSMEEVMQAIEMVGQATGTESEATNLVEDMQNRMDAVDNLVKGLSDEEKARVFYVVWQSPMTVGGDTLISQVVELAGGKNIFDDLGEQYPVVDMEIILERQPQVIVVGLSHGSGQETPLEWARTESRLKNTEARLQNKVYGIDANLVSRPGPRIVDALEEMLRLIHPNLAAGL